MTIPFDGRVKDLMDAASRASTLRQQREAALRRRSNEPPLNNYNDGGIIRPASRMSLDGGGRPASRMGSTVTTAAMADVSIWEEAKKKERIAARIKEEEIRRAEEAKLKAEADEEEVRRLERLDLQQRLANEQSARELAARKLEAETKRLVEMRLENERLERDKSDRLERAEKERLEREKVERDKLADLERRLAEAERAKLEAERLAERALHVEEQLSMERRRSDSPFPKNGGSSRDSRIKATRRPPSQQNEEEDVVADGGSDAGYQRYLLSYHQPSNAVNNDDGESAGGEQEGQSPSLPADEKNSTTSAVPLSKIRANRNRRERSVSHRSLSFSDVDETAMEEVKLTKDEPSLQHIKSLESVNLDDPKYMRSFLTKPCPVGLGTIECSIKRNKTIKNVLFPEYRIYLRSSDGGKTELCLMTSKKRAGSTTSNYLISMGRNDHDRSSESVIGKLRSNFLGTEYHIYDDGKNPEFDESHYDEKNDGGEITDRSEIRCELGAILYAASTTLGAKGPRKMSVCISKVEEYGNPLKVWQPMKKDDESISKFLKTEVGTKEKVMLLENKPPSWNNDVKAYVLNFNGRVTMASVKNFQLCTRDDDGKQIMQFGRVGDDEFNLDVQWPMSLLQAFSIALSSFDSKLGCD